jgi:endonuclease/exonuclease/phosphatase family metal-dependent hydrolase
MQLSATDALKVLTINIWNRQGPWQERFALLREGIAALAPDVIGFQEVMSDGARSLADEILEGLGYEVRFGEARALEGGISFGNAVASRWPIRTADVFPLPSVDTDERRSLLLTSTDTPRGRLPFGVTHLAWKLHHGYVREQQTLALARLVKEQAPIRDDLLPLVLVGDFNARPEASEIRFLCGLASLAGISTYLGDCFAEAGEGPGYTYDERRNGFAAHWHEPPRRIDYVFVRGPDRHGRGKTLGARVVLDAGRDGVWPSDHFGVLAEIRM